MSLELSISNLIGRYGQEIEITGSPSVHTYAFIQPMGWKGKSFIGGDYTSLGFVSGQRYLFIGPAEHSIAERLDEIVEAGQRAFRILRARDIYFRGRPVYCLGVLCEYTAPGPQPVTV